MFTHSYELMIFQLSLYFNERTQLIMALRKQCHVSIWSTLLFALCHADAFNTTTDIGSYFDCIQKMEITEWPPAWNPQLVICVFPQMMTMAIPPPSRSVPASWSFLSASLCVWVWSIWESTCCAPESKNRTLRRLPSMTMRTMTLYALLPKPRCSFSTLILRVADWVIFWWFLHSEIGWKRPAPTTPELETVPEHEAATNETNHDGLRESGDAEQAVTVKMSTSDTTQDATYRGVNDEDHAEMVQIARMESAGLETWRKGQGACSLSLGWKVRSWCYRSFYLSRWFPYCLWCALLYGTTSLEYSRDSVWTVSQVSDDCDHFKMFSNLTVHALKKWNCSWRRYSERISCFDRFHQHRQKANVNGQIDKSGKSYCACALHLYDVCVYCGNPLW